jgi:hypothetical protein
VKGIPSDRTGVGRETLPVEVRRREHVELVELAAIGRHVRLLNPFGGVPHAS